MYKDVQLMQGGFRAGKVFEHVDVPKCVRVCIKKMTQFESVLT